MSFVIESFPNAAPRQRKNSLPLRSRSDRRWFGDKPRNTRNAENSNAAVERVALNALVLPLGRTSAAWGQAAPPFSCVSGLIPALSRRHSQVLSEKRDVGLRVFATGDWRAMARFK